MIESINGAYSQLFQTISPFRPVRNGQIVKKPVISFRRVWMRDRTGGRLAGRTVETRFETNKERTIKNGYYETNRGSHRDVSRRMA